MFRKTFILKPFVLQTMKRLIFLLLILLAACAPVKEKVFVANEASGTISIIDATSLKQIDSVSLTMEHDGKRLEYAPHNVQVVGDKVLVTANMAHKEEEEAHGDHEMAAAEMKIPTGIIAVEAHETGEAEGPDHPDQLVIMDAKSHKITDRIDFDIDAHLAHVVSDGTTAYITSTNEEIIFAVNLETHKISYIVLPNGSMPHGIRLTPDGKTAIVAGMMSSMYLINIETKNITTIALPGKAVQAGIVGNIAMVSVFDTKQLALYDMITGNLSFVDLPNAKGPVQIYPTSDGKYVYIADQGVYFDQPPGRNVYKVDLAEKKVLATIDTGDAPHGVVISPDGRVWVSNLNGNSVTLIQNDQKVKEIAVGAGPNGISYWSAQ
jgi:YVTN family beta-propeller protein